MKHPSAKTKNDRSQESIHDSVLDIAVPCCWLRKSLYYVGRKPWYARVSEPRARRRQRQLMRVHCRTCTPLSFHLGFWACPNSQSRSLFCSPNQSTRPQAQSGMRARNTDDVWLHTSAHNIPKFLIIPHFFLFALGVLVPPFIVPFIVMIIIMQSKSRCGLKRPLCLHIFRRAGHRAEPQ